ncbi:MAG: hypothetical protein LBK22_07665 [Tannerella sp.]|jgi:hypothetical protein|nr:hypothetical protein [Tannerella sp.]
MKRAVIIIILIIAIAGTISLQGATPSFATLPSTPSATLPSQQTLRYSASPENGLSSPFVTRNRRTLADSDDDGIFIDPDPNGNTPLPLPLLPDDDGIYVDPDPTGNTPLPAALPVRDGTGIVLLCALMWGVGMWIKRFENLRI